MTVNGIAGGLGGAITPPHGSSGTGGSGGGSHGGSGGAGSGGSVGGGLGTGGSGGGGSGSTPGSSGGVTFGTYISFTNYGSTPWIYSPPTTQGSASTAAFPTSSSSSGGTIESLQNRIAQMRTALLTAFVGFMKQQSLELLTPRVPGQPSVQRNLTISIQIATPSAAVVQQAYQPTATPSGSILSIVA